MKRSRESKTGTEEYKFLKKHVDEKERMNLKIFLQDNAADLCTSAVNADYVINHYPTLTDWIFLLDQPRQVRGKDIPNLQAFALVQEVYPLTWKILLICSKRNARLLLHYIEDMARDQGITKLTLDSLYDVITYYRHMGYLNSRSCEESKDITEAAAKLEPILTRGQEPAESYEAFLNLLIEQHLTATPGCKGVTLDYEKAPNSCSHDGYVMSKCLMGSKRPRT